MITPTTPLAEEGIGSRTVGSHDTIRGFDRPFARVSWGAIFAGAVLALATQLVLTLLGLSIGLATIDPVAGQSPTAGGLGIGAGIWMMISTIISLFAGGYIAGRLGGTFNGWIHGLITWGACTVLTLMLLTSAIGRLVGAASGLTRFAAQQMPQATQVQIPAQLQQMLNQLQAQQSGQPLPPQAEQAVDTAAGRTSAGAFWTAFTLLLGAAAAAFGGKLGRQNSLHDEHHRHEVHEHRAHTETVTAAPPRS